MHPPKAALLFQMKLRNPVCSHNAVTFPMNSTLQLKVIQFAAIFWLLLWTPIGVLGLWLCLSTVLREYTS